MDDLISRQMAIDTAKRLHDVALANWKETKISANTMIDALKDLPSAQPERLIDDDFETIRIHLSAYKEKLCNQRRWKEAEEYQRIIDRFISFASAHPNLQQTCNQLATVAKDTNVLTNDCISRQAAIDAINQICPIEAEYDCTLLDRVDVRCVLTDLPSTQPEQRWIPCSERLPEKAGLYTVSGGEKVWISEFAILGNVRGGWINSILNPTIKAWMPLPEPYQPERRQ